MRVRLALSLGLAALACLLPLQAEAQQGRRSTPQQQQQPAKPPEPPPPAPEPPPAPYEKELLRFSEIIGSLSFLRQLCGSPDAAEWPKRMQALIEAEGTSPGRRERLAGAYNRGYRGFALTYRTCTASANEATRRYLAEGDKLSKNLAGRYGG